MNSEPLASLQLSEGIAKLKMLPQEKQLEVLDFIRTLAEIICDKLRVFPMVFQLFYAIRASPRPASSRVQTSIWRQTSYLRGDGRGHAAAQLT